MIVKQLRRISLTQWIIISMFIGAAIGGIFPEFSQNLKVISNVFLRLIKLIIVPILFSTLTVGIAGHSNDLKAMGRLAVRSLIYFEIVTTLALIIGLVAVNITQPGVGVILPPSSTTNIIPAKVLTWQETIEHVFPKSFIESAANNDVLQVVVFTILFSIALTQISGKPKETILNFCEGLAETMFKFTGIVMKFAPFGIGAAMACTVGHSGWSILINLGKLVGTLYGALIIFFLFVFFPIIKIAKIPIKKFFNAVKEPALIAFSTTSSDAALPKAIENMTAFGIPRRIVSFVLPAGYSFNLDGSTLYLAVASIFVAQAAGVHLSIGTQILMMLTLMLTTKGIAAVPRASLVILSGTLISFGLPLEGVAVILGVDELMDMARTSTNLIGNCLASAVIDKWEQR
ncbi:MAG: dicarboxylate/amino acid:cation symporter [Candidatus Kapabacteria bacterium]|nr:dicarboxylate/amino acid:cation symporter [Candidatus Kapabacteria bacterium]